MAGRYFIIPAYQRHFAWREKECAELFEDVLATARRPGRQRFMSAITGVVPAGNSIYPALQDAGYSTLQPYFVVDGQQRLTSLTVLIGAICRHMLSQGEPETSVHGAYYRFVRVRLSDGRSTLRLLPQEIPGYPGKMRSFFDGIVALERAPSGDEHIIPAQRRLERALSIFEEGLRGAKDVKPATLLECVTSRLIFILNVLGNVGDAGEVFEAINNRGIRMSTLENLKAYSIYAVQSVRKGDVLPVGVTAASNANEMVDAFNDAIGAIYHYLDRVGLSDDDASDLLCSSWPIMVSTVERARLAKGDKVVDTLEAGNPAQGFRDSLQISAAPDTDTAKQAKLLNALHGSLVTKLVDASRFYADARRPNHPNSFEGLALPPTDLTELRALHQRLVAMTCTGPFLPLLLAYRTRFPANAHGYLDLARAVERAAFWVYILFDANRGKGRGLLADVARELADEVRTPEQVLEALAWFAYSGGRAISDSGADVPDLKEELEKVVPGSDKSDTWPALAYEWLLAKGVDLPGYGRFVGRYRNGQSFQIVPSSGSGRLPKGYEVQRSDMNHPGNIVVTRLTPGRPNAQQVRDFNFLPYAEKREKLKLLGFHIGLPREAITKDWADNLRETVVKFAAKRWSITRDGMTRSPTWSKLPLDDDQDDAAPGT